MTSATGRKKNSAVAKFFGFVFAQKNFEQYFIRLLTNRPLWCGVVVVKRCGVVVVGYGVVERCGVGLVVVM